MSALQLTITQAGRNALVNAQNTGTLPLTIDQVVLGTGLYLPDEGQTALLSPIKTLTTFGGQVVADDTIHLTITDDSADGYTLGEIGLYAGSVLMAVYAQETAILEKGASQLVLLSADIQFTSLPANAITVGDTQFAYPQATESAKGVLEIATPTEAATGTDHSTAITPKTLKQETDKKLGKTETAVAAGKWATARTLSLAGDASGSVSFDGSASMTLTVSVADNSHLHTISNISGLQTALDAKLATTANAVSASKWATSRTISLTGDASGSVSLDGSANVTMAVTVADDSHNHVVGNVDGLQDALDNKLNLTGGTMTGLLMAARVAATGSGSEYNVGAFEARGDGTANTIYPTIGFHQPGMFAGTIQMRSATEFFLFKQGAATKGNLNANVGRFDGVLLADRIYAGYDSGEGNSISCSNWFRSSGATGWYNATYGGGIKMTDTTWVRTHGGKKFLVDNTDADAIYSKGGIQADEGAKIAGEITFNNGYSASIGASTGDGASSTLANVQIRSWYGVGFAPSISGQTIPQYENAVYINVRAGQLYARGGLYDSGNRVYSAANIPTPGTIGALAATANAVSASKWATARTLTLAGDASGSVSLDGSGNVTLTVAVADDSHAHVIGNVDGLQAALDAKLAATANAVSASKWATARTITLTGDISGSVSLDGSGNVSLATSLAVSSGDKGAAATTLWTGSFGTHPTTLSLASAISNFKKVRFSGVNSDNTIAWSITVSYDEWAALCATGLIVLIASGDYVYRFSNPTLTATTLTRSTSANCYLTKIVGLN